MSEKLPHVQVHEAMCKFIGDMAKENEMMKDRIKRLEEAGDALYANCDPSRWDLPAAAARKLLEQNAWLEAKEAK